MSIGDIFRRFDAKADVSQIAQDYVEDMQDLQREVEERYDAFLLDPGMGPMTYLTADGRILRDGRTWDGEGITFETSMDGAIMSLVCGSENTEIPELLELVPRLANASRCPWCDGTRFMQQPPVVCLACHGRGEVDERLHQEAAERNLPKNSDMA